MEERDYFGLYESGNAARQAWQAPVLPDEVVQPQKQETVVIREKLAISPFAVVGIVLVSVLFALLIGSYMRLYAVTTHYADLETQLSELQDTNSRLQSAYENSYDIDRIAAYAQNQLGMRQANTAQVIYVNLSGYDQALVLTPSTSDNVNMVWQALRDSFAYLRDAISGFFG